MNPGDTVRFKPALFDADNGTYYVVKWGTEWATIADRPELPHMRWESLTVNLEPDTRAVPVRYWPA